MKTKLLIIALTAAVTLGAATFVSKYRGESTAAPTDTGTTTVQAQNNSTDTQNASATSTEASANASASSTAPFEASLEQVLASGKNYGCYFKETDNGGNVTAAVYASEGRARGSFVGSIKGSEPLIGYFLINGERLMMWIVIPSSAPEGLRGKAVLRDLTNDPEKETAKQELLASLTDLYGCVPWQFEQGFFELPKDIQFVDEKEVEAAF